MKPYKQILKANRVIEDLKYNLKHSKNKVKDAKNINTLIDTLKCFDNMIIYNYKTDALDTLVCYILKDYLMRYETESNNDDLNLHYIISKIDSDLIFNSEYNINSLANQIRTYEISKFAKKRDVNSLKKIPNNEEIKQLIKNLLLQIKQNIVWNKKLI